MAAFLFFDGSHGQPEKMAKIEIMEAVVSYSEILGRDMISQSP